METSIQLNQEQAIPVRELDATAHPPPQHDQLMSERCVLCLKSALRLAAALLILRFFLAIFLVQ
jgi:hypothetical protein